MFRTSWKGLLGHKFRFVATALAVMLGVAFMAGTLVLTDTIRSTFDNLFADVYQGTDAVVRAKASFEGPPGAGVQRGRVDAALVDTVRRVDGVAAAEGDFGGYARLVGKDGQALGNPATGAPTLGLSWTENRALNTFTLVSGGTAEPGRRGRDRPEERAGRRPERRRHHHGDGDRAAATGTDRGHRPLR